MALRGRRSIVCRRCDSDSVAEAGPLLSDGSTAGDYAVADVPTGAVLFSADDETSQAQLVVDPAVVSPGDDLEAATRATARHGGRSVAYFAIAALIVG
jgi:predicted outer membrane protein